MSTHNKKRVPLSQSPAKLLFAVAASIFVCETVVMFLAFPSPFKSHWAHALLDSTFLLILLSPVLYFLVFRPSCARIEEPKEAREALKRSNEGLETRVKARTEALEKANREVDKALQERNKAEERFRNIAEMSPNMIFINWRGHVVYTNEQSAKTMGYTREELYSPQFDFLSLIDPESGSGVKKNLERHMKGEEVAPYEASLVTRHGRRLETIVSTRLIDFEGGKAILGIITDISHQKRTEESLRESEELLRRNYDTEKATNALLRISLEDSSLEELLKRSLDLLLSIPWLSLESQGCIFLVEADEPVLIMSAQNALDRNIQQACHRLPFGKCLCGRAASTQEMVFSDCIDERHDITYEGIAPHGHYCVPILYGGKTLGVINLYVKEGHQWDAAEAGFLTAVADTLASVIRRKQSEEKLADTLENLRQTLDGTVALLSTITERRDPYTAGHQRRVAQLGRAIAAEMGLSKEEVEGVETAGIVHDIGKIAVPLEILTKSTRLTDIESQFIKTHPQVGYDFLKGIPFSRPVAQIVSQHHERLDGSGYPLGLKGDEIRLEAHILAVSDVVEAMASDRPYRPALGSDAALEEISKNSGIRYEPGVVDACLRLFKEKGFAFEGE